MSDPTTPPVFTRELIDRVRKESREAHRVAVAKARETVKASVYDRYRVGGTWDFRKMADDGFDVS